MSTIYELSMKFRIAIEKSNNERFFGGDSFASFPSKCCGDTCDLLAQYLLEHGIRTFYVCGTYYGDEFENIQSHAWLITKNNIIIDITGDQFKNKACFHNNDCRVYVGEHNEFYSLFDVAPRDIHEPFDFYINSNLRLVKIYDTIKKSL